MDEERHAGKGKTAALGFMLADEVLMTEGKHPFRSGVKAQAGIEF